MSILMLKNGGYANLFAFFAASREIGFVVFPGAFVANPGCLRIHPD
jgi:hypothetical protein